MEKLNLYSETSGGDSEGLAAEPLRFKVRSGRQPRLLRVTDLVEAAVDPGHKDADLVIRRGGPAARLPRLTVTAAETPRKFFKSRGTTEALTAAAAADTSSSKDATAAAASATTTPGPKGQRKTVGSKAAAKVDDAISIYTDTAAEAAKTPQPARAEQAAGTATSRTGRSTRKKNTDATSQPGI